MPIQIPTQKKAQSRPFDVHNRDCNLPIKQYELQDSFSLENAGIYI